MVSLQAVVVAAVGFAIVLASAVVVYRDANRLEISRPALWAGFVAVTCGGGLVTYLGPPDVPIPGLLVMVIAGPALYLFERDDVKHGDEPADPHALPDGPGGDTANDRPDEE
ncbi:hypothetical protein A6E15_03950 [Natrinema saccharevitans]|uniref:Integral membrane protein n=1 Tax=Natrinema saccharevitans TaxID=301967 RepID=A0A1S8AU03_9EURY|nr:hypothetical protein [Natrinema saccharevitans]OLZ40185.1 hypothetical protein A6E15_03950 [Natrinema saccharevitans]